MDPLSITAACVGLLSGLTAVSTKIARLTIDVKNTDKEILALQGELDSFQRSIGLFYGGGMADEYPQHLRSDLDKIIRECKRVVEEINTLLDKVSEGHIGAKVQWSVCTRDEISRLHRHLEGHKSAMTIAIAFATLSMSRGIKSDTSSIRSKAARIPAMQDQLATVLIEVQNRNRRPAHRRPPLSLAMQRFLEDAYTESVRGSIYQSSGISTRETAPSSRSSLARVPSHELDVEHFNRAFTNLGNRYGMVIDAIAPWPQVQDNEPSVNHTPVIPPSSQDQHQPDIAPRHVDDIGVELRLSRNTSNHNESEAFAVGTSVQAPPLLNSSNRDKTSVETPLPQNHYRPNRVLHPSSAPEIEMQQPHLNYSHEKLNNMEHDPAVQAQLPQYKHTYSIARKPVQSPPKSPPSPQSGYLQIPVMSPKSSFSSSVPSSPSSSISIISGPPRQEYLTPPPRYTSPTKRKRRSGLSSFMDAMVGRPKRAISAPKNSTHVTHVTYDEENAKFHGLPVNWKDMLGE